MGWLQLISFYKSTLGMTRMHSSNLVLTFIQKIHPDLVERYLSGILCYYISLDIVLLTCSNLTSNAVSNTHDCFYRAL